MLLELSLVAEPVRLCEALVNLLLMAWSLSSVVLLLAS